MLYVAEISKFPNYVVIKSSTMQKDQGTINREAAFRKSDSHLGNPPELHSDRGTHFTGQIVKEMCKSWPIVQHFVVPVTPSLWVSGKTNGTVKLKLRWLG